MKRGSAGLLGASAVPGEGQNIDQKGIAAVQGLQQGSKLHRRLQEQGDLQQIPAWLQGSEAQQSPLETFLASPTALSSSQLQQCTPAGTPAERSDADDAGAGAASDETVAQLSLALAALQQTILRNAAADQIDILLEARVGISKDVRNSTPRKRLKFDDDTAKPVLNMRAPACQVTQLEHSRYLQQHEDLRHIPTPAHALAIVAAAASTAVVADSAADNPGWQFQACVQSPVLLTQVTNV